MIDIYYSNMQWHLSLLTFYYMQWNLFIGIIKLFPVIIYKDTENVIDFSELCVMCMIKNYT